MTKNGMVESINSVEKFRTGQTHLNNAQNKTARSTRLRWGMIQFVKLLSYSAPGAMPGAFKIGSVGCNWVSFGDWFKIPFFGYLLGQILPRYL